MSEKLNNPNNVRKMFEKDGWDLLVDTEDANRIIENKKSLWQGETFGGEIYEKIYGPFLEQAETVMQYQRLKDMNAPDIILQNEIRRAEKDRQIVKLTDEMIDDGFRKPLLRLSNSPNSYIIQNLIFEKMFEYGGNKDRVQTILHPIRKSKRANAAERLLISIIGWDMSYNPFYDYIEAINKKDSDGNYEISSGDVFSIIKCYNSAFTKILADEKENMEDVENYFEDCLKECVDKNRLPSSFMENFEKFKKQSSGKIKYEFMDESVEAELLGRTRSDAQSTIKISFREYLQAEKSPVNIICHELMHKTGAFINVFYNDADEFQANASRAQEAERIINEGLTEYLSAFIKDPDGELGLNDNPQKCAETGWTYKAEREIIDFLRMGGETEIPLDDFFEIYANDHYGPANKEAFLEKILNAFPECGHDVANLVNMILERFNIISG